MSAPQVPPPLPSPAKRVEDARKRADAGGGKGGGRVYAAAEAAEAFARRILVAHGLSDEDAATVAGCLVSADLRGVDTHGLCRLPIYLDRVRRGLINPRPELAPKVSWKSGEPRRCHTCWRHRHRKSLGF